MALPVIVCLAADVLLTAGTLNNPPSALVKDQGFVPFSAAPINYRTRLLDDPVAQFEKRLESGEASLKYDKKFGYLKSVLKALDVPVSSQTLVFSKTSFQSPEITPATPRALYFNDDVYVGRVHNGKFLEFISFDPMQGAIFYIMDEHRSKHPQFERSEIDCLQCHVGSSTRGVPGVMLRSVYTRLTGYQAPGTPSFITGQESPMNQRWGGWYVTAKAGPPVHMGNFTVSDSKHLEPPKSRPAAPESVAGLVDTSPYLTGSSDIVALMVLAHQTQMHNVITETNYQTRLALFANETQNGTKGSSGGALPQAVREQFEKPAEELVRYLLFTNEPPLVAPVEGASDFAKDFAKRGPRDPQGRSLRDFDLRKRIFKYPCSYLIYSKTFDDIPEPAKTYVYRRLFDVLSGREQGPDFASLSHEDRQAILEILVATKPGLPDEWRQYAKKVNQAKSSRALIRRG